jgi:alpha-mannosidase
VDLDTSLADGKPHDLMLHGWTGLTGWPPDPTDRSQAVHARMRRHRHRPGASGLPHAGRHRAGPVARSFTTTAPRKHSILSALDAAFLALDTRDPMGEAFRASVPEATPRLTEGWDSQGLPLDIKLHGIGHAHMDVAYLWPIAQIRQKNARTYSNVLRLMDRHPEFNFSHSQPQLYAWTEADYPEIFEGIKARVAQGRWEILGGMWVEPDANMPGPEALVRQIQLARTYCDEPLRRRGGDPRASGCPTRSAFPAACRS